MYNIRRYNRISLEIHKGGFFMKNYQQSLLNAVIAVVFSFVVGIALLIFNIVCIWLTNSGITFMGIPAVIIALIAFIFIVAVVDCIVRKNKISNIIFTFILLGIAAYLVIYLLRLLSFYCLL